MAFVESRFYNSLVLRLLVSFWDMHSTYVSNSSVQFILDHFVPNLILIQAFTLSY